MRLAIVFTFCVLGFSAAAFQEQPLRELDKTLASYYQNTLPLKVHLAVNQPSYVAGDTIFFNAAVVTEADQKPIDKNSILHVMLMNDDGNAVVNQKVRIQNGFAANQLVTPSSLQPGLYVLVAYHEWMKNSPPEFFFQTFILIHGQQQFVRTQSTDFEFFPEGGHLVAGVDNRVVVKGPYNTNGVILDGANQTQASFLTDEHGYASFTFSPSVAGTYTATAQNKSFSLPTVEKDGMALTAKHVENVGRINLLLQTTNESLQRARIVLDTGGKLYFNTLLKIEQGKLSVSIPTTELMQGVVRVSVFSEKGMLLAERLIFIPGTTSVKGNIALDGNAFNTRQKITAKIKLSADEDLAGVRLSSTIYNKTLYSESFNSTYSANFSLYSNLHGSLTNASLGFAPNSQKWLESVDQLLIANKKNRAPWSEVSAKKQSEDRLVNIRFSGRIVNETTGAIMTDTTFVTLFLQKNVVIYQTFASKGKFDLPLYIDFFGQDEVYYKIEKRGKFVTDARIEIVEEPAIVIDWPVVKETSNLDPVFVNARQQRLITNSFGYYRQTQNYKTVTSPNAQIEEEIFGADTEIDLEKYLVFPTMEETIREIVPMVQHRKIKNVSTIRVYFSDVNRQATINPIYIIDGVMTDDTEYFMQLKPSDVSKIKIVNTREKLQTFGAIGRGGVILVETKIKDNFSKVARSKNSFVVHGLSAPAPTAAFTDKSYKEKVPDLRTALYWNPAVVIDENGEATFNFYTSDVTGEYAIVLEGLTPSGEPIHTSAVFSVEFKPASN